MKAKIIYLPNGKNLKQAEEKMDKSLGKFKNVIVKNRMVAFEIVDELMSIIQAAKYITFATHNSNSHSEV